MMIREWVTSTFDNAQPKVFLELGAHQGQDTQWMSALPGVAIHAVEPDPRNWTHLSKWALEKADFKGSVRNAAIADHDGVMWLNLSDKGWGTEWTYSSSIRTPKNHLSKFPVTFDGRVPVECCMLDTLTAAMRKIDFIWCDIQGAEGDMIRGGQKALAKTRFLYTEYSNEELYEGQWTLTQILDALPGWMPLHIWPEDILLENRDAK